MPHPKDAAEYHQQVKAYDEETVVKTDFDKFVNHRNRKLQVARIKKKKPQISQIARIKKKKPKKPQIS